MPHILPCPAPRVNFADSDFEILQDGKRRKRRPSTETLSDDGTGVDSQMQMPLHISEEEKALMKKRAHTCPVPKPPGIIGKVLGFKNEDDEGEQSGPRIVTQKVSQKRGEEP